MCLMSPGLGHGVGVGRMSSPSGFAQGSEAYHPKVGSRNVLINFSQLHSSITYGYYTIAGEGSLILNNIFTNINISQRQDDVAIASNAGHL
jgi:hypothetical protein